MPVDVIDMLRADLFCYYIQSKIIYCWGRGKERSTHHCCLLTVTLLHQYFPLFLNQILLLPLLQTPRSLVWYFIPSQHRLIHCSSDSCNIGIYGHFSEHFSTVSKMGHNLPAIGFFNELAVHMLTHFFKCLIVCIFLINLLHLFILICLFWNRSGCDLEEPCMTHMREG